MLTKIEGPGGTTFLDWEEAQKIAGEVEDGDAEHTTCRVVSHGAGYRIEVYEDGELAGTL